MLKGKRNVHPRHDRAVESLLDNLGADGTVELLAHKLGEVTNELGALEHYSTRELEKVEELIILLETWKESV
jgi:hypothetical protein